MGRWVVQIRTKRSGMGYRAAVGLSLVLALGGALLLGTSLHETHGPDARGAGRRVSGFRLLDPRTGRMVALGDDADRRAVVLVFLGTDCPIGNLYLPRLSAMARSYQARGVAFFGLNSNASDPAEAIAAHARDHGAAFPILKDAENRVADQLEVERMCEALVLDGAGRLVYRGAIDNQYEIRARKGSATRAYLVEALDDLLAGRSVRVAETPVFGCLIDRVEPASTPRRAPRRPIRRGLRHDREAPAAPVAIGPVTYARDVAPILQDRCQACHRPGQAGPFALLTYADARSHAAMIREVVDEFRMPPWHADPRFGQFANDRSLSAREQATLLAWVEQGVPPGDPADLPPPKTFPKGWSIGTPDLIVATPEPFAVPAEGAVAIQKFRVRTGLTEERWVQAAEAQPGDRAVVHHIFVYVDKPDPDPTNRKHDWTCLVGYAPGDMPSVFPPGVAKRIPAGADLLFEVHYTPVGRLRFDRSRVGLIFARGPVTREAITKGIPQRSLRIPPGVSNFEARAAHTFPKDVRLLSLMPHMHLRGKDFQYTARYPDGTSEVLLSVPSYDFAWQSVYRLAEPKRLPRGTRIECLAHFDNSAANPANPDPTRTVTWGDQVWDEMMIGYLDYDCPASR
jgi:mono/diheme cytochrome c family protein/peroxiredoxin